jgi:phosphatidylserine synthase
VVGVILMQQDLQNYASSATSLVLATACTILLPAIVLCTGLLMISNFRYAHIVNRYLRGRRPIGRLMLALGLIMLLVVAHRYVIGLGTLTYAAMGPVAWLMHRWRTRRGPSPGITPLPQPPTTP